MTDLSQRMQKKCKERTRVILQEDLKEEVTLSFQTVSSKVEETLKDLKTLEPKWLDFEQSKDAATHKLDEIEKRLADLEGVQGVNPEKTMETLKVKKMLELISFFLMH